MSLFKNQQVAEAMWIQIGTTENIWLLLGILVGQSSLLIFLGRQTLYVGPSFSFPKSASHLPPVKILVMPKTLWLILNPLNIGTLLKTSGHHLLRGDSWTSLLTCSAQVPQVEHELLCYYMKIISSCHSSSFAGWLNLFYNLYLIIALWSLVLALEISPV